MAGQPNRGPIWPTHRWKARWRKNRKIKAPRCERHNRQHCDACTPESVWR